MTKASLFLFPTPISEGDINFVLPSKNIELLEDCKYFIVEELRSARRFLKKAGYKRSFEEVEFFILNEHTNDIDIENYLYPIEKGYNVGLMSEAGLPCVADPGGKIVALAHKKNIKVVPLVGPSSLMMALMASGFSGQSFCFWGYLPIDKIKRQKKVKELEQKSRRDNQTQIFIEAPYRNNQMLQFLMETLENNTSLCVACDISMQSEQIISATIKEWKNRKEDFNKRNCVFLIY
ncbi:MAG: SAM-dependent methyltransferase [Bacteroidales bacterium]|jgi:16S rRNA (cytidine1402-2'-O)-methyltransferase|nr:SAM-dependent methyltransferase [Bacteroidales bacterium]